jgi:hypothetical protein
MVSITKQGESTSVEIRVPALSDLKLAVSMGEGLCFFGIVVVEE